MALGALARPSRSLDFVRDYPHPTPSLNGEARRGEARERGREGGRELEREVATNPRR